MSSSPAENSTPYMALYRRWRPQLFSQIVGQQHVTRTLQNALSSARVAHAYLFCGLRGTGKTTMAKLLAKALNCQRGVAEEPCNACRSCREITEGHSLDVIEIDAASNRGIDEIRDLREKIRYAAASSRYKVYIIDEVHMLTNEAFNALLKTLEEPPPSVVFILATTEVHKLPLTVVSRCQRFEFHLIEAGPLAGHLAQISQEMNFSIDGETCTLLARLAEGSARDALGLLEQCRAYGGDGVSYEEALEILGIAHPEMIYRLISSVAAEKIGEGLGILGDVINRGKDVHRLLRELILYLRKLLMLQSGEKMEQFLEDVPGFKPYLLEQRQTFNHAVLLEMLEILQQLTMQMKGASQPQFLLELAFLRLVRAYRFRNYLSPEGLFRRLEELDSKLGAAGLALAEPQAGDPPPWESAGQLYPPPEEQGGLPMGKGAGQTPGAARDGGGAARGGVSGSTGAAVDDKLADKGMGSIGDQDNAGGKTDAGDLPPWEQAGQPLQPPGGSSGAGEKGRAAEPAKAGDSAPEPKGDWGQSFRGLLNNKRSKAVSEEEPPPPAEPPPSGEEQEGLPQGGPSFPQNDAFLQQVLDLFQARLIDV